MTLTQVVLAIIAQHQDNGGSGLTGTTHCSSIRNSDSLLLKSSPVPSHHIFKPTNSIVFIPVPNPRAGVKTMSKTVKQLKRYIAHYQNNYPKANFQGKAVLRFPRISHKLK